MTISWQNQEQKLVSPDSEPCSFGDFCPFHCMMLNKSLVGIFGFLREKKKKEEKPIPSN